MRLNNVERKNKSTWLLFVQMQLEKGNYEMSGWNDWIQVNQRRLNKWSSMKDTPKENNEAFEYSEEGKLILQPVDQTYDCTDYKCNYLNIREYLMKKPLLESPSLRQGFEEIIEKSPFLWKAYIQTRAWEKIVGQKVRKVTFQQFIDGSQYATELMNIEEREPGWVDDNINSAYVYVKEKIGEHYTFEQFVKNKKYILAWMKILKGLLITVVAFSGVGVVTFGAGST